MGYRPGPIFSEILRSLEDAQLDGEIQTQEEARKYVRSKFVPNGGKASQGGQANADKEKDPLAR